MSYIKEKERFTEIYGEYDVVVCGGGIAGVSSALASARMGAKTLLIENTYTLGGLATAGLIALYLPLCDGEGHQVSFGIAEELLKLAIKHGGENSEFRLPNAWLNGGSFEEKKKSRYQVQYNPNVYAILLEKLLTDNGVEILYGTNVVSTIVENNKISSIQIETRNGRFAILGKSFVDSSGDACLFAQSNAKTKIFSRGNPLSWWYCELVDGKNVLRLKGARDVDSITNNYKNGISGLDARELSNFTINGHQNILDDFLKRGNATDNHAITTLPTIPQVRATRSICGKYELKLQDEKVYFSDSVGMFSNWFTKGPAYELPFSALYEPSVLNLFCAGRCISANDEMWEVTRVIPVCAVSGQAVGVASALFNDYDKVDINKLQDELKKQGVKIHLSEVGL